jgi:predicted ester cyclase
MTTEENKAVIHRLTKEFWNRQRPEVFDEVFAADVVDHNIPPGTPPGREGAKLFASGFRAALPDIRLTVDDLAAEGDKVVWRWTAQGTHQGPLMGIPG